MANERMSQENVGLGGVFFFAYQPLSADVQCSLAFPVYRACRGIRLRIRLMIDSSLRA